MFKVNEEVFYFIERVVVLKVYPQPNSETRYLVELGLGGGSIVVKESQLEVLESPEDNLQS